MSTVVQRGSGLPNYVPTYPCPHCNRGLRTTNTGYICDRCRVTFGKKVEDGEDGSVHNIKGDFEHLSRLTRVSGKLQRITPDVRRTTVNVMKVDYSKVEDGEDGHKHTGAEMSVNERGSCTDEGFCTDNIEVADEK